MLTLGIIILIASVAVYITIVNFILPRLILKVSYEVKEPNDRGVKRCIFNGKRCVVYKTGNENKPFIKQYAIVQEDGYKSLKCKVAPELEYIDYDIVLFNRYNEVFKVINVKEEICGVDYTRATTLPNETSYISIVVRKANKLDLKRKPIARVVPSSLLAFACVTALISIVEAFVIKISCAYCFGGVFRESFISSNSGLLISIALAVAIGALGLFAVVTSVRRKARQ